MTSASEIQAPSWSSQIARGYRIGVQASPGIAAIAARILALAGTVTEYRAPPMARAARLAAPRAEAALPPRSRVAAITGAAIGVLMVAASAFSPRTSSGLPWIFVCPNLAPCFLWPLLTG